MVEISIQTIGTENFVRGFNRYVEEIQDFSEVYEELYMDFTSLEMHQFDTQGSRGGQGWQALSPNYARWKARHHPGKPILVLSGQMRAALTEPGSRGAEKTIRGRDKYARFGVKESGNIGKIASFHQFGTRRMPVRKVIDLTEQDKNRWAKSIQSWAYAKLNKAIGA